MFKFTPTQVMLLLDIYRRYTYVPIYEYKEDDILKLYQLALIEKVGLRQNEYYYMLTPRGKKVVNEILNINIYLNHF